MYFVRVAHDVVIREDIAILANDYARTKGFLLDSSFLPLRRLELKEISKSVVVEEWSQLFWHIAVEPPSIWLSDFKSLLGGNAYDPGPNRLRDLAECLRQVGSYRELLLRHLGVPDIDCISQ